MACGRIIIEAFGCICDICGHKWRSIKTKPPTHCPNKLCWNPTRWNDGESLPKGGKRKLKVAAEPKQNHAAQTKQIADEFQELSYEYD